MREIKFRAWDKTNKEWKSRPNVYINGLGETVWQFGYGFEVFEDVELSQYTGLKDKNGKEIYDGDILIKRRKSEGGGNHMKPFLVHWQPDRCGWNIRYMPNIENPIYYEKLGNIYENPELLNKKEVV